MIRRAAVASLGMLACVGVAYAACRGPAREQAARRYVALVACVIGPELVGEDEAEVLARRLHPLGGFGATRSCAAQARAVATVTARLYRPDLVASARAAERRIGRFETPDVRDLLRHVRGLPWRPPAGTPSAPRVVLDRELSRLRAVIPYQVVAPSRTRLAAEDLWLDATDRSLVVASGPRGAWSEMRWDRKVEERISVSASSGRVWTTLEGRRGTLGPGDEARAFGRAALVRRGAELVAFSLDAAVPAPSPPVPFPGGAELARAQVCVGDRATVIALDSESGVAVLALLEGTLSRWGVVTRPPVPEPGQLGAWLLSCDHDAGRVAYAESHPGSAAAPLLHGDAPFEPSPLRHHTIVSARCDATGCERREGVVHGVETNWHESRLDGRARWDAPDAVAFGDHVLVVWSDSSAARYREGALDGLDRSSNRWLAECDPSAMDAVPDPRRIQNPSVVLRARDDVALVSIVELESTAATFFVRFADDASPAILAPARR